MPCPAGVAPEVERLAGSVALTGVARCRFDVGLPASGADSAPLAAVLTLRLQDIMQPRKPATQAGARGQGLFACFGSGQ